MLETLDKLLARYDPYLAKVDPNDITKFRLYLVPVALGLLLYASPLSLLLCLLVMLVIEVSDRADGYVARKFNKISDYGKIYDPMTDVVCHMSMYLCLIYFFGSKLFAIAVAIILYREIRIAYLRVQCAMSGVALAALPMGKAKVASQIVSIFCCVIWLLSAQVIGDGFITGLWYDLSIGSMAVAVGFAVVSLLYYQSFVKKNLAIK